LPQGRTVRQRLRDFLRWALNGAAPMLARRDHGSAIQGGGALALRYGQTTTHIVELTRDRLITGEAGGLPASENPAELWQA
jgi:hypothetical protein